MVVEYDPGVTGVSLASACKEVNVGWSGYISATVYPSSAPNRTVYWSSSDPNVASVDRNSGLICTKLAGSTVITATTADGGFTARCTLTVRESDPFHPSNIEYVRIKKYENSDTITTVVQSTIQSAPYFKLLKYDGEEFDFIINSSLINQLNSLETAYNNLPTAYPPNAPFYFHVAKLWVDKLVSDGILEYGTPEYYGMWASSGNSQLEAVQNFTDQLQLAVTVITIAYSIYNVVTSIRALSQAVNSTQTISHSQYVTYYNQTRNSYLNGGTGYSSFDQVKRALGSAGPNKAWHHIVEQNQISGSGFSATDIHNTKNLISIPSGYSGSVHSQITGHYASIQPYTNGMTVRQWLAGQSFQAQFEYGLQQLNNYGTVLATEMGWVFISK